MKKQELFTSNLVIVGQTKMYVSAVLAYCILISRTSILIIEIAHTRHTWQLEIIKMDVSSS